MGTLADARALASMHVASWHETYAGMVPPEMLASLSVDGRAATWTRIMSEPATSGATIVYLAELENRIAGFGSCGAQRTETLRERGYDGEISAIYVLEAFQRRSIGTRLLFALASDLLRRAFGAASLWVLRDNARARRFYERLGARVLAEREDVRKDAVLVELAYGWMHLTELARIAAR
jgi:ribosomal protein S18 acetylase RimI-like enzyme